MRQTATQAELKRRKAAKKKPVKKLTDLQKLKKTVAMLKEELMKSGVQVEKYYTEARDKTSRLSDTEKQLAGTQEDLRRMTNERERDRGHAQRLDGMVIVYQRFANHDKRLDERMNKEKERQDQRERDGLRSIMESNPFGQTIPLYPR